MLLQTDPVRIDVLAGPQFNYAMWLNGVRPLYRVGLTNTTSEAITGATLHITAQPAFVLPFACGVDIIPPNETVWLDTLMLQVDAALLAGMTERVEGLLQVQLCAEEQMLGQYTQPISVLTIDQWQGSAYHPEHLASFVTPNHPAVGKLAGQTARLLGQWTGDTALDAYQSGDPNRVLQQAAAAYAVLSEQQLSYAVSPAGFETRGQRIRLCDTVLSQKLCNCLEAGLLYAALLEAMGLHPLLILQQNHLFAGVWLKEYAFPEVVQDDAALLTKRLADGIGEVAVVECTGFCQNLNFDQARHAAEQRLRTEGVEDIIDVFRARLSGILPLPQRVQTEQGWIVQAEPRSARQHRPAAMGEQVSVQKDSAAPADKRTLWERSLLDLSLRNNLLNLRFTASLIPVLSTAPGEIEDALAQGADLALMPRPLELEIAEEEKRDLAVLEQSHGIAPLLAAELKNKRLRTLHGEGELQKAALALYRAAKLSLEENGANTLYLALGLLKWYESPRQEKPRYAPVVLLPVDIVRRSGGRGYVLRLRDEEPQINVTLLELLKQDFNITVGGLSPLPRDEKGIDLRSVFAVLRQMVMGQKGWDVLEYACLGIFSFTQFVMWNDLHNRAADLAQNKVVRSLMDGKLSWQATDMDDSMAADPDSVLLPLPADGSQLYAIVKAAEGNTFVLHGPPGTGKSQTITALIANALAQGKTVLFVADKMAALSVVQRRLAKLGLAPFCLELHSNKSRKRDVLEQLRIATQVTRHTTPAEYAAKAAQLRGLRTKLDAYCSRLHRLQASGLSLHDMIEGYTAYADAADAVAPERTYILALTSEQLSASVLLAERLAAAASNAGDLPEHPLASVLSGTYTQQLREALPPLLSAYTAAAEALHKAYTALPLAMPKTYTEAARIAALCGGLLQWASLPQNWAGCQNLTQLLDGLADLCARNEALQGEQQALLSLWKPTFLQQDGAALVQEYEQISAKWVLPRIFGMRGLRRKLALYASHPLEQEEVWPQLNGLAAMQQTQRELQQAVTAHQAWLQAHMAGEEVQYAALKADIAAARSANAAMVEAEGLGEQAAFAGRISPELLQAACTAWSAFAEINGKLDRLLGLADTHCDTWLADRCAFGGKVLANLHELRSWMAWRSVAMEAESAGMRPLVYALEHGLAPETAPDAWKKGVYRALCIQTMDGDPELAGFTGALFEQTVAQFARLDAEVQQLAQQEIYCRLAARLPDFAAEAAQSSELGILQRAIRSGGRGMSLRRLFDQLPGLLPRLCPCMLMSPISAAQYLDPAREPFDLVVFDEASQLPTCKAVGALARGSEAVIVGDPKQLPPTTFFMTNQTDEDAPELEDLESILDDCLALNLPQSHLRWHYRSRHESLIAFSNGQFYENGLYTYPSVDDAASCVQLHQIDGYFDRGRSRCNEAEARAVVAELIRRCHDPLLRTRSVGVVTFNIKQQNLIDDLFQEACRTDAALEGWAYQAAEPLFIKNLENVQGDERDCILFSITYGADQHGHITMNFGPINRDGGWRRLNVAVTRARMEMHVFATLRPEQIDLSRTAAEGVAALKSFLEYAAGRSAPSKAAAASKEENAIAAALCKALESRGYTCRQQVGRSAFRVDVAVEDPADPSRYLLGILLDGDSYRDARATRDREVGRTGVLSGLGWNLARIWSPDWWADAEHEVDRIAEQLEKLRLAPPPGPLPGVNVELPETEEQAETVISEPEEVLTGQPLQQASPANVTPEIPVYQAAQFPAPACDVETLIDPANPGGEMLLRASIRLVLVAEAPVLESTLVRRIQAAFEATRSTRLAARIREVMDNMAVYRTQQGEDAVCWLEAEQVESYTAFREAGTGDSRREAKEVPHLEAANSICAVLKAQIGLPKGDLLREAARLLGYARLGGNVQTMVEAGLALAEAEGRAVVKEGYVSLPDEQ